MKIVQEGWARPSNARKFHYFRSGRSVCRRWAFFGQILEEDQRAHRSHDDCARCQMIQEKEEE